MIKDLWTNDRGTLHVYRETYKPSHPKKGQVNPVWQMKIKVRRGVPAQKMSTGHSDKRLAQRHALTKLDQLIALDAQGFSISSMRFREVARQYLKHMENENRINPDRTSDEKLAHHKRCIRLHFDDIAEKAIGSITSKALNDMFRDIEVKPKETYSSRPDLQQKKSIRHAGKRSASGMNKIKQVARAVFKHARDRLNIIKDIPVIQASTDTLQYQATLSKEDWIRIQEYLDTEFVKELDNKPTDQTRPKYYRQGFVDYSKLVVWTGLRASEALKLQWRDISWEVEDDYDYCLINVAGFEKLARKTKDRKFRADFQVYDLLMDRRSRVHHTNPRDYIFTHFDDRFGRLDDGRIKPIGSFRGTFKTALKNLKLDKDPKGKNRVPYQWRHLHAQLSRQAGKSLDDIAEDIGNKITTTERYYVGRGQGTRKGKPIKIS